MVSIARVTSYIVLVNLSGNSILFKVAGVDLYFVSFVLVVGISFPKIVSIRSISLVFLLGYMVLDSF